MDRGERESNVKGKVSLVIAIFVLGTMMVTPLTSCVKASGTPAVMSSIQYVFFDNQNALFAALTTGTVGSTGVDSMQWPLTYSEYQSVLNDTNIVVEPMQESGEFELAFNNNWTDGVLMDRRSPMNYTDFRNAMNCLVNKQGVINGPTLQGFATECDTQVPTVMGQYVNLAVSGANYPWQYNVTHALEILYSGGWYNRAVYPSFGDLIAAYGGGNGTLSTAGGTVNGVVYSGNDSNGQWGGGDPLATANAALANTPLQPLIGIVWSTSDARIDFGNSFCAALQSIGCPYTEIGGRGILPGGIIVGGNPLNSYVFEAQRYDFATLGYSFGSPPNWWYTELTPAGIYSNGPNPYLVQDSNTTEYAYAALTDENETQFNLDQQTVQYNLVLESYLVPVYCPETYCAYRTGMLRQLDIIGQGTGANGLQVENWVTLDSSKNTTIAYTGPPSGAPTSNTLYLGLAGPPDQVNPLFQDEVVDFQVTDEIFTYPLASNPYTMNLGSTITGDPSGGDLPWMAYAWTTQPVLDPYNASNPLWTNVTLWFRNDITWQDGVPFTDLDLNYTIYLSSLYGDAFANSVMVYASNVSVPSTPDAAYQAQPGDPNYAAPYFTCNPSASDPQGLYCCSVLVKSPGWMNLYLLNWQVLPQHLYQYITPSNLTAAEQGTAIDGLHGLWPGEDATAGNILPGAPFTLSQLQNDPETTLVGTGPFEYRPGSTNAGSLVSGEGITLDAYPGFFMKPAGGAIAFQYTWVDSSGNPIPTTTGITQPYGGYFKVGLTDLLYLAMAYGTHGTPPSTVSVTSSPGSLHIWNPAADLAAPSGVIGLSDLVVLASHYGWYYGNYSYNAPYPPAEVANGGP